MANIITVTLLRHGVTKANMERRYLGWTDLPLTGQAKKGLEEVQKFGKQFDFCMTSDLLRAKQTAEILCPNLSPIATKAFRELDFGEWEMKTYEDLKENPTYRAWIDSPMGVTPPNGESLAEMKERVDAGFQQLKSEVEQRGSKHSLVIAHGGVIRYLLTKLTRENKVYFDWVVSHDTAYQLSWEAADWKGGERCTSLREVPLMANEDG